tara:strand:+ start:368 stop:601 length:234 start_codon:yes stop_codon:yes gene_type:complete
MKVYRIRARVYNCKENFKEGGSAEFLVQKKTLTEAVRFIEDKYRDWPYFSIEIVDATEKTETLLVVEISRNNNGEQR